MPLMVTTSPTIVSDDTQTTTPSPVRDGVLAVLPLIAGYVPFALVVGSVVADHGAPLAGWSGSWLIFGGSAHVAAIRTLDQAGAVAAIFTGVLVNARLIVYSTSLARRWGQQPTWFRLLAAGLIIDPTWAVAERHLDGCTDPRQQRHFFLAAGVTLGAVWSAAIGAGALMGARLDRVDLDIVIPLCLLALVGGALGTRDGRRVIVAAATVAVLTATWPAGTGILAAVAAGGAAGLLTQRTPERS